MKQNRWTIITIIILITIMAGYSFNRSNNDVNDSRIVDIRGEFNPQQQKYLEENKKLKIGFSDQVTPFVFLDEVNEPKGLAIDYVKIIAARIGQEVEPVILNQKLLKESLLDGRIDGALMVYEKEKTESIKFTNPLFQTKIKKAILLNPEDKATVEKENGGEIYIGGYVPNIDKLKLLDTTMVDSVEAEVRKAIKFSKTDSIAILGNEPALRYFLKEELNTGKAIFLAETVDTKNFCIGVLGQNSMTYATLNESIYRLDGNLAMEQLSGKWLGVSYPLKEEGPLADIGLLFIIVLASVLCVFYIFYGSNKSLYEELESRMDQVVDSKNELQATFDGVSYSMVELDTNGKIVNINKSFRELVSEQSINIMGNSLTEVLDIGHNNKEILADLIFRVLTNEIEEKVELKYGRKIIACHISPIRNARLNVVKLLVNIQDVTKEKMAESQMIQDNKMIAVGQLAAGVAHEIRNPLGLIRNYCYVLKTVKGEDEDKEKKEKAIGVIEKAVEQSGRIIDNLLNFSRISGREKEQINLKAHINSVLYLQKKNAENNNISLILNCEEDMEAFLPSESLDMVLINLTTNGMDAIIGKKEKWGEDAEDGKLVISCTDEENGQCITIEDNGEGMNKDIVEEIYHPFFTTKEKKNGNGLGLYIVYNEVQKMNGTIEVESECGIGTRFSIRIPKMEVKDVGRK